jgi:uncharacterized protein (DUF58 family)
MSDLPLLILALLFIAIFLRIDFIYYIAYVCTGVYVWSQWVTPFTLGKLRMERHFQKNAFLGERVPVELILENTSRLPLPWVQFVESVPIALRTSKPADQAVTFRPREKKVVYYEISAMRRGYYQVGPTLLTTGDLFGFSEKGSRLPPNYLTIYPRIVPLHRLGFSSRLPFGTLGSKQRLFEDPARPSGVRNFRSGDSLRHINWKVSARKESLLVKTFQPAISLETMILLNLNRGEYNEHNRYDGPEWSIVVAASLAAHLAHSRQSVGLATNGIDPLNGRLKAARIEEMGYDFDEESGRLVIGSDQEKANGAPLFHLPTVPPKNGREHLMKVLELLARIETDKLYQLQEWVPKACLNLNWGVTILTVTPQGDEKTCQVLHRLVRSGYNPILLITEPSGSFGTVQERARRLGFTAYQIAQERDLNQWRKEKTIG